MWAASAVVLLVVCGAGAIVEDAIDIIKLGKDVIEEVLASWDVLGKPLNATGGVELPLVRRRERLVLAKLDGVTRAIEDLELLMERSEAMTAILMRSRLRDTRLELRLHELSGLLTRIGTGARQMREYVRQQQQLERSTLEDFAWWCVAHDPGALPGLLERLHALCAPPHHQFLTKPLMNLLATDLEEKHPDLCDLQVSPHQLIYDMYNTVSLTEIKGYAMMQFSWMLLRIYGKGNFTQEASLTRQRYGERTVQTATAARAALAMARRDTFRCDPPTHKEGETYAQVTRLLQGYLVNEVDLNDRGTCSENCPYYTLTRQHSCYNEATCDRLPQCNGRIIDCQYIDSDMWVYPASRSSNRRYEMIQYENGKKFGASSNKQSSIKVDSWWRWNLLHCSYCFCLCEDPVQNAERFFSLKEVTADNTMNKVVTGLRFIKLGRVFHLQISEGTLGARGHVTAGTWVPVQAFDPNDVDVKEDIDYHTLSYVKRAMDLDELDSPAGHVLTGVRFRMIGAHLHFEIRSTPFNYTTGRLVSERSQWISNDNTDGAETPRKELHLFKPDIPTRSSFPLEVDSQHDQYIQFVNSDFDADAAQSTVPFIDIQPLMPMKGSSLSSGAGVIHRGAKGSGGFIALKLFTYDYSRHVKAEAPPSTFIEDTTEFMPIMVN